MCVSVLQCMAPGAVFCVPPVSRSGGMNLCVVVRALLLTAVEQGLRKATAAHDLANNTYTMMHGNAVRPLQRCCAKSTVYPDMFVAFCVASQWLPCLVSLLSFVQHQDGFFAISCAFRLPN